MQDHVVSQITLINGEKIWVREEKGPSWNHNSSGSSHGSIGSTTSSTNDDCNSSTDSINICVGLPLLVSTSNQVAELDLSADMMDLSSLFNSTGIVCKNVRNPNRTQKFPKAEPNSKIGGFQVLGRKPMILICAIPNLPQTRMVWFLSFGLVLGIVFWAVPKNFNFVFIFFRVNH